MSRLDISWAYCIVCETWVEFHYILIIKFPVIYSVSGILCRSADCDINVSQQTVCIRPTITTSMMLITTSVCNLKYIKLIFHTANECIHYDRCDTASAAARLEHCVTDIGHWLKLNAEKTELLWTGTKHSLSYHYWVAVVHVCVLDLIWCTLSFTGFTFQIELSISSVYSCWCSWWATVHQFLMSFSASVCVQPAVTNYPYHATDSACTADGRFLLLARLSGTPCPKTFGIWSVVLTVTDSRWRRRRRLPCGVAGDVRCVHGYRYLLPAYAHV